MRRQRRSCGAPGRGTLRGRRFGRGRWHRRAYEAREFARARLSAAVAARSIAARSILARASPRRALAAPIALIVVLVAVATLALTSQAPRRASAAADRTGIGAQRGVRAAVRPSTRQATLPVGAAARRTPLASAPAVAGASTAASTKGIGASGTTRADSTGASSDGAAGTPEHARTAGAAASAAQLQAQGHQLLGDGRYAAAIGDLRAALTASGQSTASCRVPTSEACLTYAYALYDIGLALRLEGDPGAAVGVLSERLQIDNQQATVQEQLDLARAATASGGAAAPAPKAVRTLDGGVRAPGHAGRERPGHPRGTDRPRP